MDLLSQHEAFLRAIFDAPEDDTPRLVYADFLQENGEDERAEFIRLQVERARLEADGDSKAANDVLVRENVNGYRLKWFGEFERGMEPIRESHTIEAERLEDVRAYRAWIVECSPSLFAASGLDVFHLQPLRPHHIDPLFALPCNHRVSIWNLGGYVQEATEVSESAGGEVVGFMNFAVFPVVTTAVVETLAQHCGARRITSLDLRNNELDNDAARALVKSPYLDNLKRLRLLEGNQFRGRVWQQVRERFGEDVVE
ncbi:MAG: TIGR02996 domain-containing protein [Planctomycetes bacterium]|nr:TIGR02996 domain-containing protein [Planctomycetota bacterium]